LFAGAVIVKQSDQDDPFELEAGRIAPKLSTILIALGFVSCTAANGIAVAASMVIDKHAPK
jgi:hypothetical protein